MLRLFLVLTLFLGATLAETQDACQTWKEKIGDKKITKARNQTGGYYFHRGRMPWYDAQNLCRSHGMSLAVFETHEEMLAVKKARPEDNFFWVGASDIDRNPGEYYWTDGTAVNSTWRRDRGNHGEWKKTCLILDDELIDAMCYHSCLFFCEVNAEYKHCV